MDYSQVFLFLFMYICNYLFLSPHLFLSTHSTHSNEEEQKEKEKKGAEKGKEHTIEDSDEAQSLGKNESYLVCFRNYKWK